MKDAKHQVRATEHREVELQVGLTDGERLVLGLVVPVDPEVFIPAAGLEVTGVFAIDRRDVETLVGFLRHWAGTGRCALGRC